jgi:hypothetical protein
MASVSNFKDFKKEQIPLRLKYLANLEKEEAPGKTYMPKEPQIHAVNDKDLRRLVGAALEKYNFGLAMACAKRMQDTSDRDKTYVKIVRHFATGAPMQDLTATLQQIEDPGLRFDAWTYANRQIERLQAFYDHAMDTLQAQRSTSK